MAEINAVPDFYCGANGGSNNYAAGCSSPGIKSSFSGCSGKNCFCDNSKRNKSS